MRKGSVIVPQTLAILDRFGPVGRLGWVRASLGALCALALTGLICRYWLGSDAALPALVAPIGASSVLLFAVPASPLAQPWSIIGGNTLSALAGVACAMLIPDRMLAGACAAAAAIGVMSLAAACTRPAARPH